MNLKQNKSDGQNNLDDHSMWILDRLSAAPFQSMIEVRQLIDEARLGFI